MNINGSFRMASRQMDKLVNIIFHTLMFMLFTIIGSFLGVLLISVFQQELIFNGWIIGIFGIMFAWPALLFAAIYAEIIKT